MAQGNSLFFSVSSFICLALIYFSLSFNYILIIFIVFHVCKIVLLLLLQSTLNWERYNILDAKFNQIFYTHTCSIVFFLQRFQSSNTYVSRDNGCFFPNGNIWT